MNPEPFVATPEELIWAKIAIAKLRPEDFVLDLGCGDGMVLIRVAETVGARCLGVEVRPDLARRAARAVTERSLDDYIRISCADYLETDLSGADVILLYLDRGSLGPLSKKLEVELRPGARVVTHSFDLPGWSETEQSTVDLESGGVETVYLYTR